MYLLKLGLRPWKQAFFSQIFTVIAVGVLLFLGGFLFWIELNLTPLIHRLRHENVLTAYLAPTVVGQEEKKMMDTIQMTIGAATKNKIEVRQVGIEEFIKELENTYPALSQELMDLGPEINNIVPRHISISGILPDSIQNQVKALPGIEFIESSSNRHVHTLTAFQTLQWIVRILAIGLGIALLTAMIHLTRMNTHIQKEVIDLLRFWGAGIITLRLPGFLTALSIGSLGGMITYLGWTTLSIQFTDYIKIVTPSPLPSHEFGIYFILIGALVGFLSEFIGGFFFWKNSTGQ